MALQFFIGTSGWNYPHWKKRFYPESISKKDWFAYYCEQFHTVEINYSFYRWPSEQTLDKWYNRSPGSFTFTLKAPRLITHMKKLQQVQEKVDDFYALGKRLKEKMGCYLFQLPPFIKPQDDWETLKRFVKLLDGRRKNVIEFRSSGWWQPRTYELLEKHHISFCTVSGLSMPDDIITTADVTYLRFHGKRYDTRYSHQKLSALAKKIKNQPSSQVYAYFNNDEQGYAPQNAQALENYLQEG